MDPILFSVSLNTGTRDTETLFFLKHTRDVDHLCLVYISMVCVVYMSIMVFMVYISMVWMFSPHLYKINGNFIHYTIKQRCAGLCVCLCLCTSTIKSSIYGGIIHHILLQHPGCVACTSFTSSRHSNVLHWYDQTPCLLQMQFLFNPVFKTWLTACGSREIHRVVESSLMLDKWSCSWLTGVQRGGRLYR